MSEYAEKINSLLEKSKNLQLKQERLIERRKIEIGDMAQKYNILTVSDAILSGAFSEISQAAKLNQPQIKKWEAAGTQQLKFQNPKFKSPSTIENESEIISEDEQKNHAT